MCMCVCVCERGNWYCHTHEECRWWVAHLRHVGLEPVREMWHMHGKCDNSPTVTFPVAGCHCPTNHIILLGDRDTCVNNLLKVVTLNPWQLSHKSIYTTQATHTQHTTVLRLCGNCPGQPGWAGTRRNIHSLHSSWSSIIPICFFHLLRHMASSIFNPRALQSFSTISLQVFFGLPLGLVPSTSCLAL